MLNLLLLLSSLEHPGISHLKLLLLVYPLRMSLCLGLSLGSFVRCRLLCLRTIVGRHLRESPVWHTGYHTWLDGLEVRLRNGWDGVEMRLRPGCLL